MTPTPHTFAEAFAQAQAQHGLDDSHRERFSELWEANPTRREEPGGLEQLAGLAKTFGPIGAKGMPTGAVVPEGDAGPAPTGRPGPPRRLDQDGARLYRDVEARADRDQVNFFTAMADVTGVREYADLAPRLLSAGELEDLGVAVNGESRADDQAARVLMSSYGIDYVDAAEMAELHRQLGEAKAETGASGVAWTDTRPLETPPVPWSNDDWERDRRRAAAAGIELTREEWEAAAEEGRDTVGDQAEAVRRERIEELEQHVARTLLGAQEREAEKRAEAVEQELRRRAAQRLGR